MPESDPYYLGNFACKKSYDRLVASITPSGEALAYCRSTPPSHIYKKSEEYRLAYNHVEFATDASKATAQNYERIAIAVFDDQFEFMSARSRFYRVCGGSKIESMKVPMLNEFFSGVNPSKVQFSYCDVILPGMNGSPEQWRVGSFTDQGYDWAANTNTRRLSPPTVEMTYMMRANHEIFTPAEFAKRVQDRILKALEKVSP
jgi:hypothetical protein